MCNFKQLFAYETIKVFGGADRICDQTGRDGNPYPRGVPSDGGERGHLLQVDEVIGRAGRIGTAQVKEPRRGELAVEETGGRPEPGHTDLTGRTEKKVLRPSRKRGMVDNIRMEYNISIQRCCKLV